MRVLEIVFFYKFLTTPKLFHEYHQRSVKKKEKKNQKKRSFFVERYKKYFLSLVSRFGINNEGKILYSSFDCQFRLP